MADAPESFTDVMRDLERGLDALDEHHGTYLERSNYLEGKVPEVILHPALARKLGKYAEHFRLNYAAVPVDALSDRIDLSSLSVTSGQGDAQATDEALTARLNAEVWDHNDLDDDADEYHRNALGLGDYYVIAWPTADDGPDVPAGAIDLFGKSPLNCRIIYDRKNSRVPEFGIFRWSLGKRTHRVTLYYDDTVVELIAENTDNPAAKDYRPLEEEAGDEGRVENPYGFPVFHFRPDSKPYGTPVNEKAYGAQDAITKINATELGATDYAGLPQRWALLDPDAEEGDDIDDDFTDVEDVGAVDSATSPSRITDKDGGKLDSSPGSAWLLRGVKSVGQFESADPAGFIAQKAFQIRAAATLTRTPLYEFDLEGETPSGEARRRADAPITKHARKVMGTFGQTWADIGAFALKVWNVGTGKTVAANWMPAELATDKEGLELVALKVENGVPPRAALLEAGYTVEEVDKWLPEGESPTTPALVIALAGALASLGQAQTLGAISNEQVRELLPSILTSAAPEPPAPAPAPVVVAPPAPAEPPAAAPPGE